VKILRIKTAFLHPASRGLATNGATGPADCCAKLPEDEDPGARMAESGWRKVRSRFSWEQAARRFEQALVC
jgi:hypothetical protein